MITPKQAAEAASNPLARMAASIEALIDTNLTVTGYVVISSAIRPDMLYSSAETLAILEERYREAGWITSLDAHLLTIQLPPSVDR